VDGDGDSGGYKGLEGTQLEAGGATLMRTRCLPLNERRPQGKKAPAAFEGVVRSPRLLQKNLEKREKEVTKSRNSCQFSTTDQFVCLLPAGRKATKKYRKNRRTARKPEKKHRDKSSYQNWKPTPQRLEESAVGCPGAIDPY